MTAATFFQLLTLETLEPPNLRTTQLDSVWLVIESGPRGGARYGAALILA
jgi:hypothetical protein